MSSFLSWVNGESGFKLKPVRQKNYAKTKNESKQYVSDEKKIAKYAKVYRCLCAITSIALISFMLVMGASMPEFGNMANATNNEVPYRYVSMAEEETGAENAIAGMILNYRGFDTFGESCVLFLAVCSVMILVWEPKSNKKVVEFEHDSILSVGSKILIPLLFLFGFCVLMNGHVSPGGGFSGGSILGASLILFATAFGKSKTEQFFTERVFNIVRITGLMIYAVMFGIYIFQGANTGESSLARYIVLVIDLAVGLVVMSTMYGFYCFFEKGRV